MSVSVSCLGIEDFNVVYMSCDSVRAKWETLAIKLEVHRPIVEEIERSSEGDPARCLRKILSAWLKRSSPTQPKPSWRSLCDALAGMGEVALSERIQREHPCGCGLCSPVTRATPVSITVQQENAVDAAKELKKDFNDLLSFLVTEISEISIDKLRYQISLFFKEEGLSSNDEIEKYLTKIEDYDTPNAILNFSRRHRFIGYINYSLVKVFQKLAKSPLLDKRIEVYEKDFQCFLELNLTQLHNVFQQCQDLFLEYLVGIPNYTIHLESEFDGRSVFGLKDFLKEIYINSDCIDQLKIAKISRPSSFNSLQKSKPIAQSPPSPLKGGYDDGIFLSPPPKDLQCIVCKSTVRDPQLITCCGAIVCKICMSLSNAASICPKCHHENPIIVDNKHVRGQTMGLKVKCTKGDCTWTGELVDYDNHIKERCPFRIIECQYGCGQHYMASNIATHEEECVKASIGFLDLSIKKEELDMVSSRIGTIKGRMKVQRTFLHGPPGVGKSSIQRIILGDVPPKPNEQNSTGIMQPPERLVTTNRLLTHATANHVLGVLQKAGEQEILRLIARELRNALIKDEKDKIDTGTTSANETDVVQSESEQQPIANDVSKSAELKDDLVGEIAKNLNQLQVKKEFVNSFFSALWVHLIDSGGQPQFTDLLPLVYPSENNLIFFVIRLDQCLDQQHYSEVLEKGKRHKSSEVLTLTSYQMIKNVCKIAKLSGSRVKIIGTHLDRIGECDETKEEKEKKLESLKGKYEAVLIPEEDGNLIYMLNAMEENPKKREEYQQKLNRLILDSKIPLCVDKKIPLKWLILQLLMNRESRAHNGVLSYAKVKEFADTLEISNVECAEALQLFSKLALSFYFPKVFSDVVIDELGVLTCRISEIIRSTFDVSITLPTAINREALVTFQKTGIFDKCLLSTLCCHLPIIENFTINHLLRILQHLKMIHALPPSDAANPEADSTEYFFPGILPLAPPDKYPPLSSHSPLLLFWDEIPLPHAFFSTMVVTLLEKENISLCRGKKKQQYRNDISLECWDKSHTDSRGSGSFVGVISLVNKIDWMEIFLCSGTLSFDFVRKTVISQIRVVLTKHLKKQSLNLSYKLGLLCPKEQSCVNEEDHPCTLMDGTVNQFQCTLNGTIWSEKSEEKMQWFYSGKESSNSAVPPLPVAVSAKLFDVQSVTFSPNASAKDVIRIHLPDILNGIANYAKFGNDLAAMSLVPEGEVRDLASRHGISDYDRSNRLVDNVQRGLWVKNDPEKLRKLCIALQRQKVRELNELVEKMLLSIGTINEDDVTSEKSPPHSPIQSVKRPKTTTKSTDHPDKEAVEDSSKGPAADDGSTHVERIKWIFNSKEDLLKSVFSDNLQSIATKMAEAEMISQAVEKNPSYESLMKEFFEGLSLLETKEIEEECSKFLGILNGFRGPSKKLVCWFQRELKKCGYSVN